jgi:hypothetical protein
LKINNLPAIWRNNEKASMTATTMGERLNMFNAKNEEGKQKCHPFS